jgi:hypothetical protein
MFLPNPPQEAKQAGDKPNKQLKELQTSRRDGALILSYRVTGRVF